MTNLELAHVLHSVLDTQEKMKQLLENIASAGITVHVSDNNSM